MTDPHVQVVVEESDQPARVQVVVGREVSQLRGRLPVPQRAADRIVESAVRVLSNSPDPDVPGDWPRTGLTLGRVQSGKTLSIASVIALAADNGFDIVVALVGSTKNLVSQGYQRLSSLLGLDEEGSYDRWEQFRTILAPRDERSLADAVSARSQGAPGMPPILVVAMKNHTHILPLAQLLDGLDCSELSALIIDDEADQASLNTAVSLGQQSTTYRTIMSLRQALPRSLYVQYTATPHATLLLDIVDVLSPEWCEMLQPGDGYLGVEDVFAPGSLIPAIIPDAEANALDAHFDEPPATFVEALRVFLVGVAAGYLEEPRQPTSRSMMIHPASLIWTHQVFMQWLSLILDRWKSEFALGPDDPDWVDVIEEFRGAYADVLRTVSDLPSFDSLAEIMPAVLARLKVEEINSDNPSASQYFPWSRAYAWILVGGDMLNRGFTVEGLTVTYMPRGVGVGNLDTVQQRARFLGYKQAYAGYCRVYLTSDVNDFYHLYARSEKLLWDDLSSFLGAGNTLRDWPRRFLVDASLRPTRRAVISLQAGTFDTSDWLRQRDPALPVEAIVENRRISDEMAGLEGWSVVDSELEWGDRQAHRYMRLPIADCIELLEAWRFVGDDRQRFDFALVSLADHAETNPATTGVIWLMTPDPPRRTRSATVSDGVADVNVHQGRSTKDDRYPGDREIAAVVLDGSEPLVQLQVFRVDVSYPPDALRFIDSPSEDLPLLALKLGAGVGDILFVER